MKKIIAIILAALLASFALVACGNGGEGSTAESSEAQESSKSIESSAASSQAAFEASEELSETESEDIGDNSGDEGDYSEQYIGEWLMDGGEGHYNLIYFNEEGDCITVSPNGDVSGYTYSAFSDRILLVGEDGFTEEMPYEDGALVDMAGFRYLRDASISGVDTRFVGVWSFDGGEGENYLRLYPNGAWSQTSADGTVSNGSFFSEGDDLYLNDEPSFFYNEDGKLEDQAGFCWEQVAQRPY